MCSVSERGWQNAVGIMLLDFDFPKNKSFLFKLSGL
jgi:hypothetical protein